MLHHHAASNSVGNAQVLVFSAHTPKAVKTKGQQIEDYLKSHPARLKDVAFTLAERREHFKFRAFYVVLDGTLSPLSRVETAGTIYETSAFVFTGQGAQWATMGRDLLARSAIFRTSIARLDNALKALPEAPKWTITG
jgi:acyl transferase domain-containing protein